VYAVWALMLPLCAYIFLVKHNATMTWNHLAEQILLWLLVTFGLYTMIDIPKFTQGAFSFLNTNLGEPSNMEGMSQQQQFEKVHSMVLLLWCTILFSLNLVVMWIDGSDYKKIEAKEAKKEDKQRTKEETSQKRRAEKKRQKKEKLIAEGKAMDPKKKKMIDMVIYVCFGSFCAWAAYRGYFAFVEYQEHLELLHMDNKIG
jgi:hypothetical protein